MSSRRPRRSRTSPGRSRPTCSASTPPIRPASSPNPLGVVAGDLAGFPNGRRVFDDVVTVELRAIAGALLPLVDPSFTPDAAVDAITDGLDDTSPGGPYLTTFPYLGVPYDGYDHPS